MGRPTHNSEPGSKYYDCMLAQGRPNMWEPDAMTLEHLRDHLVDALGQVAAMHAAGEGGARITERSLTRAVALFDHLDELDRCIPKVECWTVGRMDKVFSRDPAPVWQPLFGFVSEESARKFLPLLQEREDRSRHPRKYEVQRGAVHVRMIVAPGFEKQRAERMGSR